MKEILSRLISSIIIAVSILVSTKMYVDSNKYTFFADSEWINAATQEGDLYRYVWHEKEWGKSTADKLP